ncbi:type IV secretion system protein [Lysinibacillus sphaericus]|uniref:Uncharacterized protein n=1 Tax=Lysinibacillus sphaericus TaxID=1421 RepID=A0A6H0A0M7_LYSSH|nr:type IV secretion system protein [Lysinibacillus sphaericus]QIS31224.1 hypothetical protein [Lysinibacillus sphaericus]
MRILKIVMLLFFCFFISPFSANARVDEGAGGGVGNQNTSEADKATTFNCPGGALISKDVNNAVDKFKDEKANLPEKFIASQLQNFWNIGDINSLSTLIYGNPYCVWADSILRKESSIVMSSNGIFTQAEKEHVIDPILKMFQASYIYILVLAIMVSSVKTMLNSTRGRAMSDLGDDAKMWVASAGFILFYPKITGILFELNAALVLSLKSLLESKGVNLDSFSLIASWKDLFIGDVSPLPLSYIMVIFAEWVLAAVLNGVYILRKILIGLLLVLGFVAAFSLLFARTRPFFGAWLKELCSNVFLQSVHAIVLYTMILMSSVGVSVSTNFISPLFDSGPVLLTATTDEYDMTKTGAGTFFKLIMMAAFIPVTGLITRMLKMGDSTSKLGTAMTMLGVGGFMSTYNLTKQAGSVITGGSVFSSMSNSLSGGDSTNQSFNNTVGTNSPSDSNTTSITMNALGNNSTPWKATKDAISKGVGISTAIGGGMILGPPGAQAGFKLGSKSAELLMQTPRSIGFGVKGISDTLKNAKQYSGPNGVGMKGVMGNLAARRQFFGNMGESVGVMVGQGAFGRQLGQIASGVSRQAIASLPMEQGGMMFKNSNGLPALGTFQNLAHHYPNEKIQFIQNNQGSGFYLNDNGTLRQIGLTGAADPSLENGVSRVIDYKFRAPNSDIQLDNKGSYSPGSQIALNNSALPSYNDALSRMSSTTTASNVGGLPSSMINPIGQPMKAVNGYPLPLRAQNRWEGHVEHIASPATNIGNPMARSSLSTGTTTPFAAMSNVTAPIAASTQSSYGQVASTALNSYQSNLAQYSSHSSSIPSLDLSTSSISGVGNRVVGLPGSTDSVSRTSGAYFVGGLSPTGQITTDSVNMINNPLTPKFDNPSFRADHVNPDSFVYHISPNADLRNNVDIGADKVNQITQRVKKAPSDVQSGWAQLLKNDYSEERKSNIS